MDEQDLHDAYARLTGSIAPPPGVRSFVAGRVARRRRRRTTLIAAAAALVVTAGTATAAATLRGDRTDHPPIAADPSGEPPALPTCPSGELTQSAGGFMAAHPVRTDPAAVALAYVRPGDQVVVRRSAREARVVVVREDGTARAVLTLPRVDGGWSWEGTATVCSDDSAGFGDVPPPDDRTDQVTCGDPDVQVTAGRIVNPAAGAGSDEPADLGQQWRADPSWEIAAGAPTDVPRLVTVTDRRGRVRASVETARDDDGTWRVTAFAACSSDVPGLPAHEGVDAVALPYGHCWIGTLELEGHRWQVRDEDQFGWGGGGPVDFRAVGTARVDGDVLTYVDATGTRLGLVPADSPGTEADQGPCS